MPDSIAKIRRATRKLAREQYAECRSLGMAHDEAIAFVLDAIRWAWEDEAGRDPYPAGDEDLRMVQKIARDAMTHALN